MSNVLPLTRPPSTPEPQARLSRRIRLGSRALVVLFTVLAVAVALMVVAMIGVLLFYRGGEARVGPSGTYLVTSGPGPADTVAVGSLPLAHRLAFVPVVVLRTAPGFAVLLGLRSLFGLYARGIVFARENTRQIKLIGVWLVIDALVPFMLHIVQGALGIEIDRAWFHAASLQELVLGALVFVIAEVMRVGHQIEQERAEFI